MTTIASLLFIAWIVFGMIQETSERAKRKRRKRKR